MWPPVPTASFHSGTETCSLYPINDSHESAIVVGNDRLILRAPQQYLFENKPTFGNHKKSSIDASGTSSLPSREEYWKVKDAVLYWHDMLITGQASIKFIMTFFLTHS